MSTHSSIAIFNPSIEIIIREIEEVFIVGRKRTKDFSNEFEFFFEVNLESEYVVSDDYLGGTVMIVHHEHNPNWVQIDYDLGNVYVLDEMLRNITLKLNTIAFIGFNQTASGDFRFALFENGKLLRSIYQKYLDFHNQMRLMDNYGKKLSFEKIDFGTPFTRELPKEHQLNFETLNDWQGKLGFVYHERSNLEYIHLEILKFRN